MKLMELCYFDGERINLKKKDLSASTQSIISYQIAYANGY